MMIVAIAHTTSRHTTSTTTTTTGTITAVIVASAAVVTVGMVTIVEVVLVLSVVVILAGILPSVAMVMSCNEVSVVMRMFSMVTGSVLSGEALVVTVCDSAVAAVDSD